MVSDFIVKWPLPRELGEDPGYAYFRTFSCELERLLFRLRHAVSPFGIACTVSHEEGVEQ